MCSCDRTVSWLGEKCAGSLIAALIVWKREVHVFHGMEVNNIIWNILLRLLIKDQDISPLKKGTGQGATLVANWGQSMCSGPPSQVN